MKNLMDIEYRKLYKGFEKMKKVIDSCVTGEHLKQTTIAIDGFKKYFIGRTQLRSKRIGVYEYIDRIRPFEQQIGNMYDELRYLGKKKKLSLENTCASEN